jgi:hypothetical protein
MPASNRFVARLIKRLLPKYRPDPSTIRRRIPFGTEWGRVYLREYLSSALSQLHVDIANDLGELVHNRGQRRVYISPRGSGKTVWCSTAYPLYGAVEGIEPLTLLMAETGEQAKKYLESIKDELIYNDEIAKDYPAAAGKGTIWQSDRIRLRNGCEILARGAGGRILGVKNRNSRPSLIVIDDGNEGAMRTAPRNGSGNSNG